MDAKKLEDSILQYAMQGKLVQQDPDDEPASELLKRIKAEKEQLIAQKIIKKEKELPPISEDEIPFEIPDTWEWVRIRDIYYNRGQKKPDNKFTYIDIAAIDNQQGILSNELNIIEPSKAPSRARKILALGDVIYATVRPYLLNIAVIDKQFEYEPIASTAFVVMTPIHIDNEFLYFILKSPMFNSQVESKVQGVTYPAINDTNFNKLLIPVPPVNEQRRIVNVIRSFQPKISALRKKQMNLNDMQTEFPTKLQKSILHYAMQGKIVPQDANDEPAIQLIEQIKEEKELLVKQNVIKNEKVSRPISEDEVPFEIPETWEWVRLNDISTYIQRGKSPTYSSIEEVPVVSQKCIQWSGFTLEPAKFIDPKTLDKYDEIRFLKDGDLLWNSTGLGTVGRINRYSTKGIAFSKVVVDSHVTIIRTSELINSMFVYYYLASPQIQESIEEMCTGSTKQKELNTSTIKNVLIPLPPINEQNRIVQKISKLLNVVNQLNK